MSRADLNMIKTNLGGEGEGLGALGPRALVLIEWMRVAVPGVLYRLTFLDLI